LYLIAALAVLFRRGGEKKGKKRAHRRECAVSDAFFRILHVCKEKRGGGGRFEKRGGKKQGNGAVLPTLEPRKAKKKEGKPGREKKIGRGGGEARRFRLLNFQIASLLTAIEKCSKGEIALVFIVHLSAPLADGNSKGRKGEGGERAGSISVFPLRTWMVPGEGPTEGGGEKGGTSHCFFGDSPCALRCCREGKKKGGKKTQEGGGGGGGDHRIMQNRVAGWR